MGAHAQAPRQSHAEHMRRADNRPSAAAV